MARETRLQFGSAPRALDGVEVPAGCQRLSGREFLLRGGRFTLHYRQGEGITAHLEDERERGQMDLMLAGSVRSAVACINGLYPFHASAVAVKGRVIAFAGPSGCGKSTLAAALNRRSVPLFCDDTLVMDLDAAPPVCLPGHKRLKLWPDAADLAGAALMDLVSDTYRKYYCTAKGGDVSEVLPLGAIVRLAEGPAPALERLHGGKRIAAIADDHYTADLHQAALNYPVAERLRWLGRIAGRVPVFRFSRPLPREHFEESTDFIHGQLEGIAEP